MRDLKYGKDRTAIECGSVFFVPLYLALSGMITVQLFASITKTVIRFLSDMKIWTTDSLVSSIISIDVRVKITFPLYPDRSLSFCDQKNIHWATDCFHRQ